VSYREIRGKSSLGDVGRCIYCGAEDDLSDEHVVPYALNGHLYVGNASCPRCRDLTSEFELRVLRGFMLKGRTAGDFATRRPGRRPSHVRIVLKDKDGSLRDVEIPREKSSALIMLPIFRTAGVIGGVSSQTGLDVVGLEAISFGEDIEELVRSFDATGFTQEDAVDVFAFARLLAKIGYSFAVGLKGCFPLDQSPILPLIRGELANPTKWIGSAVFETETEKRGGSHALQLVESGLEGGPYNHVWIARIKLFASSRATGYEVVVRVW